MKQTVKRNRRLYVVSCGVGLSLLLFTCVYLPGLNQRFWTWGPGPQSTRAPHASKAAQWQVKHPSTPTCTDTCFKARDGVCDEGRTASAGAPAVHVQCDLGSDCSDCGPWAGHLPKWPGPGSGPIAFVRSLNASLLVKLTTLQPPFLMPITVKERDPDVSAMLDNYGAMEGGVTRVVHEVLGNWQCIHKDGSRGLVLDVGANFGYFALYAAMTGCRVIAWEPVELFRAFLHHGIALNNLTHLVEVRSAAVSDNRTSVSIGVPRDGSYWGLASVDNLNLMPNEVHAVVQVDAERLDTVVAEPVLLLKVDVEGYEPQVIASASQLLGHDIKNILLEYSPGICERSRNFSSLVTLTRSLEELLKRGFVAGHLPMKIATPWPPKEMSEFYQEPMPVLDEVTLSSVALDIKAATMRQQEESVSKGCPVPEELKRFPVWAHCTEWAYAAHPKGFRSSFGFNTNVWLSRNSRREAAGAGAGAGAGAAASSATPSGVLRVAGQASLFAASQDMKVWSSELHAGQSIGFMDCERLGTSHKLVFRCPCTEVKECGAEQEVIQKMLAEKKMPMQEW